MEGGDGVMAAFDGGSTSQRSDCHITACGLHVVLLVWKCIGEEACHNALFYYVVFQYCFRGHNRPSK
jgi:hypothetical protein